MPDTSQQPSRKGKKVEGGGMSLRNVWGNV